MYQTPFQLYRSNAWANLRQQLMIERTDEDGVLRCEHCGQPIVRPYDCIAHHKTELTPENVSDVMVSLNPDNIALVHHNCHDSLHSRFGGNKRQVYLVYGPPCAGKSTWVHDTATTDDLIVDLDALWEAISVADRLHKPPRLKPNVFGLRDCLIDQIRTRTGNWCRAYVIGGYPIRSERDRLCDLLRAREIYIDTPEQVCLERAPSDEWRHYIREWFEAYDATNK